MIKGNLRALAAVTAIIDGTGSVGAALGPLLTGYISTRGWNSVFVMLILATSLAGTFVIHIAKAEEGRKKPSMETISPERRFSPEFARESLIAISQSVPETTPPADVPPKGSTVVNVVEINGCSSEEYRSKLISIAYSESPDVKTSPVPSVNPGA
ncbi:hypothetical protein Taro_024243 [Colocasia esculenta]|uniref:Major facilitator superfamily (MFS) profile domain-containing protein n=1 Tax=Colocasia esculenta TaxID=4460 RepID=A0A843VJS9_COLES|nr:hypothetical protein [Colocasia esculenta]